MTGGNEDEKNLIKEAVIADDWHKWQNVMDDEQRESESECVYIRNEGVSVMGGG